MSDRNQNKPVVSLTPILSVNFVGTLGFSIVMPFLIFLVTRWGGNALIYGIIGATYSFFQMIGAPVLGRWSDRIGRKRVLLVSQLGTLLSWMIFLAAFILPQDSLLEVDSTIFGRFTLTLPLLILFLARGADGITGGNVSVASAYLADITDENMRNENFGKLAISSNLGFILGPALAGLLGSTVMGEVMPVLAALVVSAAASLIIIFQLPESKACVLEKCPEAEGFRKVLGQEHKECYRLKGEGKVPFTEIMRVENIRLLMTLYFLIMMAFNFFYISFPVYATQKLGWSVANTGMFFTFLSVLMVIVQGPVLKRASKKWTDSNLIISGSLSLACGFALYSSSNDVIIYLGTALLAIGNGIMWPSLLSVLSRVAGQSMQGAVQGYAGSAGAVASILGLIVGGVLYGFLEQRVFLLAALIIVTVFVASFRLKSIGR
jgi:MFS family permease